jgi:hypothetical protein
MDALTKNPLVLIIIVLLAYVAGRRFPNLIPKLPVVG